MKFRYVVFRPFIDEVLVGKIKSSSSDGVQGIDIPLFGSFIAVFGIICFFSLCTLVAIYISY